MRVTTHISTFPPCFMFLWRISSARGRLAEVHGVQSRELHYVFPHLQCRLFFDVHV